MVKLAVHVVFLILLRISAQAEDGEDREINEEVSRRIHTPEIKEKSYVDTENAISTRSNAFTKSDDTGVSSMSIFIAEQISSFQDAPSESFTKNSIEPENVKGELELEAGADASSTFTPSIITETSSSSFFASSEFSTGSRYETFEDTRDILPKKDLTQEQEEAKSYGHVVEDSGSLASSDPIPQTKLYTTATSSPFFPIQTDLESTSIESYTQLQDNNQKESMDSDSILSTRFKAPDTTQSTNFEKPRLLSKTMHIPTSSETKATTQISEKSSDTFSHASPISDLPGLAHEEPLSRSSEAAVVVSNMSRQNQGEERYSEEGKFLSFEQWKKLKEAGSKLESSEVKIEDSRNKKHNSSNASSAYTQPSSEPMNATFEDQGRVYKDKFNYASVDCAATIVKTNSDAKGASAILTEVKDSYLLNKCSASSKFVVIELCQDILVSSVVMGNYELFSSMFRTVKFSVSDRFPVTKGWHELGQFEAQNIRDTQTFNIENPLIWARYLKIEIVSHYGNEFYCPISLVRVHGKTMMEEFKDADQSTETSHSEPSKISTPTEEYLNNSAQFDSEHEECKVLTPYLALNEFLKDLNSTDNYCDVPLVSINVSQTATAEPTNNNKPTQESIFQNIVKRLSLLETNATLSLLYVEEQSKLLSDAFFNLEHRQVRKFENLLIHLNETMYTQVLYLEKAVEKIKTDSIRLFQAQSSISHNSIDSLRMETLSFSREISFLRKVVIADTLIILSLLIYVIVTRETLSVEELTEKQKQQKETSPITDEMPMIRPFSHRQNRPKARRRKHK